MKITIDISDDQLEALNKLNVESNAGIKLPDIESFIASFISDTFDTYVNKYKILDLDNTKAQVAATIDELSPEDLAVVKQITDKYSS